MIKLQDNIVIDADKYGYVAKRYIGLNKKGEEMFEVIGYHAEICGVLECVVRYLQRICVRDKDMDIHQAIKELVEINRAWYNILNENLTKLEKLEK